MLAKAIAKKGIKEGLKHFAGNTIKRRLAKHLSQKEMKEFAKDVADILGDLDSSWWEVGIELIPVAGDLYGGTKLAKKVRKAYGKLQDLENKYVKKIHDRLKGADREEFVERMRGKGVRDARCDVDAQKSIQQVQKLMRDVRDIIVTRCKIIRIR